MLKENVQKVLNEQLNAELYSSYLYLSMSTYFQSVELKGFANWMRVQAQEELSHAMKFYDYVNKSGGRVILKEISAPQTEWNSPRAAFEHVFKHEQKVTSLIDNLVGLASKEKDQATNDFLQWFVKEQVEEESSANEVLEKVKLIGDKSSELQILDQKLGKRVFTSPAPKTKQKGK